MGLGLGTGVGGRMPDRVGIGVGRGVGVDAGVADRALSGNATADAVRSPVAAMGSRLVVATDGVAPELRCSPPLLRCVLLPPAPVMPVPLEPSAPSMGNAASCAPETVTLK